MSLYIIGVGGTGARCLESVIQIASAGLLSGESINLLFIDADETNGNLERTQNSLATYQKGRTLLSDERISIPWLQNDINSLKLWSPLGQLSTNKNLGSVFSYNTMQQNSPGLRGLFDVLYTKDERDVELDVGFLGRPAIGSAVMSQIDLNRLDEDPWRTLVRKIKTEASNGEKPKIIFCGSIFGGTGAAGLPTIGRILSNKLQEELRDYVSIACIFILPYFSFDPPLEQKEDDIYARADSFLLNTEAALHYYLTQAEQTFNTVYLIGNQVYSHVNFSKGKQTQRNEANFIELLAGLAVRHYATQPEIQNGSVVLISRQSPGRLTWDDLPDRSVVRIALVTTTRFAYVWLSNIAPDLLEANRVGIKQFQKDAPWFTKFFQPSAGSLGNLFSP